MIKRTSRHIICSKYGKKYTSLWETIWNSYPTGKFSWGEQQNSMECRSEVILVGRRVQGSSPRGHLIPWYYVWLKPTLSVIQFQEHLTHLFTLRANCPIFQPGTVPLVIFFQSQWSICLASKHCQVRAVLEGGWGGEQKNYSATQ